MKSMWSSLWRLLTSVCEYVSGNNILDAQADTKLACSAENKISSQRLAASLKSDSEANQRSYRVWSREHPLLRSPPSDSPPKRNKTTTRSWGRGAEEEELNVWEAELVSDQRSVSDHIKDDAAANLPQTWSRSVSSPPSLFTSLETCQQP